MRKKLNTHKSDVQQRITALLALDGKDLAFVLGYLGDYVAEIPEELFFDAILKTYER